MGHRALVARERADGRYDVHRSQWAGVDLSLARTLAREGWPPPGRAPVPVATAVAWQDLLADHLDPLVHEALFVVPRDGPVRAYRTVWLGADHADPDGLIAAVDRATLCDDERVLAWVDGARAVAREADVGPTAVERCLREWRGDREVVRVP
jgi:hypothetical protein